MSDQDSSKSTSPAGELEATITTTTHDQRNLVDLEPINDIQAGWDMLEDKYIPKAGVDSTEDGWGTVRIATFMIQSNIDTDDYVVGDLISSKAKTNLLAQLEDTLLDTKKRYDETKLVQQAQKYGSRAQALAKAIEVIETSMQV